MPEIASLQRFKSDKLGAEIAAIEADQLKLEPVAERLLDHFQQKAAQNVGGIASEATVVALLPAHASRPEQTIASSHDAQVIDLAGRRPGPGA